MVGGGLENGLLRIGIMEKAYRFDPGGKTSWRTSSLKRSGSHPSIRTGVLVEKGTGCRAPGDTSKGGVGVPWQNTPVGFCSI